jgi:hypothetical protein
LICLILAQKKGMNEMSESKFTPEFIAMQKEIIKQYHYLKDGEISAVNSAMAYSGALQNYPDALDEIERLQNFISKIKIIYLKDGTDTENIISTVLNIGGEEHKCTVIIDDPFHPDMLAENSFHKFTSDYIDELLKGQKNDGCSVGFASFPWHDNDLFNFLGNIKGEVKDE